MEIKIPDHISKAGLVFRKVDKTMNDIMFAHTKKDASHFIKRYQRNLRTDHFHMHPLNPMSIKSKIEKGESKPNIPLYGAGKNEDNSYYYMFLLKKIQDGYEVHPRWAKHYEGNIQLKELLKIHEYGCTITVTPKMRNALHYKGIHLKADTTLLRIPPRPIAYMTYREILQERKNKSRSKELRASLTQAINTGNTDALKLIKEREKMLSRKNKTKSI